MKRMRKFTLILTLISLILMTACSSAQTGEKEDEFTVGIMLSDVGLGDQSFSDSAFNGLMNLRDELGILFDYRELNDTETYEQGLNELVAQNHDIIIGLGFMVQEDLEKVAKKNPNQTFILVDAVSDLENIVSLTFKEEEGSFLAGAAAAYGTQTNTIGFVGGADVPLINKFMNGFIQGAKTVNPDINIITEYANSFGDDKLGSKIANDMIEQGADVLYAAAGFTGVGVLKEAERQGVYSIGVDSDQYFYAENSVFTSMVKNIDLTLYKTIKSFVNNKSFASDHIQFGIREDGVGLAPFRNEPITQQEKHKINQFKESIISEKIIVKP